MTNDERIEFENGEYNGKLIAEKKTTIKIDNSIMFGIDNMSKAKSIEVKHYWQGYTDALGELKEYLYEY